MTLSVKQLDEAHQLLFTARSSWRIDDFSLAAFGEDYDNQGKGRQKYLQEKFKRFQDMPLRLINSLDLALKKHFFVFLITTCGHKLNG